MQILTNHIGYETYGPKRAVLMMPDDNLQDNIAYLISLIDNKPIAKLPLGKPMKVANWSKGCFCSIDFSHIKTQGRYFISISRSRSEPFSIQKNILFGHRPNIKVLNI